MIGTRCEGIGDWGLGIRDWGLGIGDWGLGQESSFGVSLQDCLVALSISPIPNPQSLLSHRQQRDLHFGVQQVEQTGTQTVFGTILQTWTVTGFCT